MYAILSNGALVSLCEKPRYVKKHKRTGVYVEAEEADAVAVAVSGMLYNIDGQELIKGAPQAIVVEREASEYIFQNKAHIEENAESANSAIITMEDALCEMDMISQERMTAMEDALCELDMAVSAAK